MDEVIIHFIQAEERIGAILTARLSFEARLDLIQSLAEETIQEPAFKDQLDDLIKRIRNVQKERNQLVHSRWHITNDTNIAVLKTIRAKQKLDIQFANYTAGQIKGIAEEVDYVMRDLSLWIINQQIIGLCGDSGQGGARRPRRPRRHANAHHQRTASQAR
jgi:hypothetical protein